MYQMRSHIIHMNCVCCHSKFHTCHCWSRGGSRGFGGSAAVCSSIVSETNMHYLEYLVIIDFIFEYIIVADLQK